VNRVPSSASRNQRDQTRHEGQENLRPPVLRNQTRNNSRVPPTVPVETLRNQGAPEESGLPQLPVIHPYQRPLYIKDPSIIEDIFMTEIWERVFDISLKLRLSLIVVFLLLGIIGKILCFPSSMFEAISILFHGILGALIVSTYKRLISGFQTSRTQYKKRLRLIGSDEYFHRFINDLAGKNAFVPDNPGTFEITAAEINRARMNELMGISAPRGLPIRRPVTNGTSSIARVNPLPNRNVHVEMGSVEITETTKSDGAIPLSSRRPHVTISLDRSEPIIALVDSGANSCLISKEYLSSLEVNRESQFPRLTTKLNVFGINSLEKNAEIAL
jgi:hypothetical protein